MPDWFDQQDIDTQQVMRRQGGGGGWWDRGYAGTGGGGDDMRADAGTYDPFGYTRGSLLTPWQDVGGRFSSQGYGGGYSVPEFKAFSYGDFTYQPPSPGRFDERYENPADFRFADFNGPAAFKAPTVEDLYADPGYQARLDAGRKAIEASAAHRGVLRSGGTMQALSDQAQAVASDEYGRAYGRRASEWDREHGRAKDIYGINRSNVKEAFDTNVGNRLAGYNTRLGAFRANADVALQEGQLGYNVAQGTWDRNYQKARQGYDDERAYAQSVASAANAAASQNYQRALGDYMRDRDEFWTSQDRQYALLDREANRGLGAAQSYGNQLMNGYGAIGNLATGRADSRASGYVGSANAWNSAMGNIGNYASDAAMAYADYRQNQGQNQGQNRGRGRG